MCHILWYKKEFYIYIYKMNINAIPVKITHNEFNYLRDYFLVNGPRGFENYSYFYNFSMAMLAYGFEAGVRFINHHMSIYMLHSELVQPMIFKYDEKKKDYMIYCHPDPTFRYAWAHDIRFSQNQSSALNGPQQVTYKDIFDYLRSEKDKHDRNSSQERFVVIEHTLINKDQQQSGWYRTLLSPIGDPKHQCFVIICSLLKNNYYIQSQLHPFKNHHPSQLEFPQIIKKTPLTTASWYDRLLHSVIQGQLMMKDQPMIQIHATFGLSFFGKTLMQSFGIKQALTYLKDDPSLYTDRHGNGMWIYKQISEYPQPDDWIPQFYTYSPNDSRIGQRVSTQQRFLDKSCGEQRCNYLNVQRIIRDNTRKGLYTVVPWIDRSTKKPILFFDLAHQHIEGQDIYHFGSGMTWRILA
jgi:hypothetical protein